VTDPWSAETFTIAECRACGLGHTVPQPADLGRYYRDYHRPRHPLVVRWCARRRARMMAQVTASGGGGCALLDIGCGDGSFLLEAQARGWRVAGTELAPTLARSRGLEVFESLDDARPRAPYDCVTLWHSLEHVRDPRATLLAARALLAPTGALVVAVPNAGGLQARSFGRHWFHLDVPRHLLHFGERSLVRLLETTGFEIVRRWHQEIEYDALGWSQSLLNRLGRRPNAAFYAATGRQGTRGTVATLASVALAALAAPAVPVLARLGAGAVLIVAARPRVTAASQAAPVGADAHPAP
jgi:SAM-dependent methyltransferase